MTALQVIDQKVLFDTLKSISEVATLVSDGGTPPVYNIFWEHVDADQELPYIVMTHIMGRRDLDNSYSNTTWKIVGVTASITVALAFANAISKLDHITPITTAFTNLCGYTYIEEILPVFDRFQVQNSPVFMVGGMYRLRLNLGNN